MEAPAQGFLRSLRHRAFLALWLGQTASRVGDALHRFALAWWVLETTGSGVAMGTVVLCQTLPMLPFLLIGGAYVDRFDRVRVMLVSDVSRLILTGIITLLLTTGQLEVWHLYIIGALFAVVDGFFQPAYSAIVPVIVPVDDLPSANALTTVSGRLANVIGASLGAVIVAVSGASAAFAVDTSTFVISALCLLPVLRRPVPTQPSEPPAEDKPKPSMFADMREGFAVVGSQTWLWLSIVTLAIIYAADYAAFTVALPYLILEVIDAEGAGLGAVQALASAGAIFGALWIGRRSRMRRRGVWLFSSALIWGACWMVVAFPIGIYGIGILIFLQGTMLSVVGLVWTNILQENIPADKLGRVWSIDWFCSMLLLPVGAAVVGWVIEHYETPVVFAAVAIIAVSGATIALLQPSVRSLQ